MTHGFPTGVSAKMPYQPAIDEILYVEGRHTIKIDRWRIEYYSDLIRGSLSNPKEYVDGYFSLIVKMLNEPSVWNGFTEEQQFEMKLEIIDNFCFTNYIHSSREIVPSLFVYHSKKKDGSYRFQQFVIGQNGIWDTLQNVLAYMDYKDRTYGNEFELQAVYSPLERDKLVRQMQECSRKLRDLGMEDDEIMENLFGSKELKNLVVTQKGELELRYPSGKIFVRVEPVKLAPLDRAIYLLFLRHPEGINFSYLPDYREELMQIYRRLMNYRTTVSMRKSVEDVTDPTLNSINEKCARIRRAFIDVMGNYMASKYYITGSRGEAKKIVLDRKFVIWEEEGVVSES